MPVAIVIDERAAGAPLRRREDQAGFARDVGKGAVAVVAEEDVLIPIGEEEVVEAVVVVIADGTRPTPSRGAPDPDFAVTSVKVPSRLIHVESIACAGGCCAEARAAEHQNVEPAIMIVIEESDAAAVGLEDVAFGIDVSVDAGRSQAGVVRNVGELRIKRQSGTLACGCGRMLRVAMPCAKRLGASA